MLTEEQRLLRQSGVGGSDIGALLGLNPYKTPLDLYFDKVNPLVEEDHSDNEAIIWGNLLEAPILKRYSDVTGHTILASDTRRHPDHPFILATPDGLIEGLKKGVEIKTVGPHAKSNWFDNQIPQSYFMQVQHCMFVYDYDEWDLAALFEGQEMKIYNFKRDKDFDAIILDACKKFWHNHVEPRVPPPIDFTHDKALAAIKKFYDKVEGTQIELDADTETWVKTWLAAKEQVKKFTTAVNTAQAHLLDKMQNNATGILPTGELLIRKEVKVKAYSVKENSYITLTHKGNSKK